MVIEGIFSYVSYAKRTIPFVNLVTNGYFLTPDVASELQKAGLDMISISIDGFREKHDLIRGKEGSFDRAMSAISYMKRYAPQVGITVNTIISSWNLEDIFSLADLTADLGVLHKFQPILRHPSFTGQTEPYQEFDIGDIPVRRIKELVKHLLSKSNVANSRYFLSAIPGYFTSGNNGLFNEKCKLVNFFCEFRENGQMYPCLLGMSWEGGYPVEIGGVKQIFHSSRYRKDVKRLQYCKACKRNLSVCYVEPRLVFPVASYMRRIILPCHSFFKKC